jgi:hypothetical protein
MRIGTVAIALVIALLSGNSASVEGQDVSTGDCQYEPGGTIRGVVVNDSTGVPVPRSHIYLFVGGSCRTTADFLGRFVINRVPSGTLRIETGFPGYRQFAPVTVEVTTGDTTDIELRLVPGGPLQDCRALPDCSALVDGGTGSAETDSIGFRVAALGTAIGLAWATVREEGGWYACIEGEPAAVRAALSERYSLVADADECGFRDGPSRNRLRHVETDRAAFRPRIGRVVEVNPRRRTVALSYYVAPLWAAGWDCDFERSSRGWRATICIATWVS